MLYKHFELLMRIKDDKNIINIPPINIRTKILQAVKKPLVFKMTKKCVKVGLSGDQMATPSNCYHHEHHRHHDVL